MDRHLLQKRLRMFLRDMYLFTYFQYLGHGAHLGVYKVGLNPDHVGLRSVCAHHSFLAGTLLPKFH